jgi:hypothetical protein
MITGMDDYNYTELFSMQASELTGKTPFCPEDQQIAEYFDGDLNDAERINLERHLTDCRFCLARIGILNRLEESIDNRRVPEAVLATAKQLPIEAPVRRLKFAPTLATAAVVVLALFTVVSKNPDPGLQPSSGPPVTSGFEETNIQLRSISRDAMNLSVLKPAPGADILPGSLIQWAEIPGKLHYNIYVLSSAGDVLWTERLGGTDWALDESLHLAANSTYYFRVEAILPDGRVLSSKHVSFGVTEQE